MNLITPHKLVMTVAVILLSFGVVGPDIVNAQSPPPLPMLFSGTATVSGVPVPDGFTIVGKVGDYVTEPVEVAGGRYRVLTVGPPNATYSGQTITFHLEGVQAGQTETFVALFLPTVRTINLIFPALPQPTPTPTIPPTATPTITPTPIVAQPSVYSGLVVIHGGTVPSGAQLVARIGDYESIPAYISDGNYLNLVLDPGDASLIGEAVKFFLNGIESRTTDVYIGGQSNSDFDLVFVGMPTPTPTPTPTVTPAPPTPTPTPTAVLPTMTPIPTATNTPVPTPTSTVTPTRTPTPAATNTPVPTPTPEQPTPTVISSPTSAVPGPAPEPEGGGACSPLLNVPASSGAANLLLMMAPIGLIAGFRRIQKRNVETK